MESKSMYSLVPIRFICVTDSVVVPFIVEHMSISQFVHSLLMDTGIVSSLELYIIRLL